MESPLPRTVEWLPCGVTKLSGFLTQRQQQRLFDTAMIAGWDHRKADHAADSWYTGAADAPDILLHYNYYSEPRRDQPPSFLLIAAAKKPSHPWRAGVSLRQLPPPSITPSTSDASKPSTACSKASSSPGGLQSAKSCPT